MAIPAKPTITPPPAELPTRGENPADFSDKINNLVGWYPRLTTTLQDSVDWADVVFTEVETLAQAADADAATASNAATTATQQATRAESEADSAEASAAAAQSSAGLPAIAGKTGNVLTVVGGSGSEGVSFESTLSVDRYDVSRADTTATLDLDSQQVFTVDATANRTLSFANAPGSSRAMTVVIRLSGSAGAITWPAGINWSGGEAPELNTTWTAVTLFWDGSQWSGFKSGGAD